MLSYPGAFDLDFPVGSQVLPDGGQKGCRELHLDKRINRGWWVFELEDFRP